MPATAEDEWGYWDAKVTELTRGQLDTIQKAGTALTTLFGALIAVFSTVAFAGGLTTVDKLDSPWANVVKVATLIAVVAAIFATVLAAKAAQSIQPRNAHALDANSLMEQTYATAQVRLGTLKHAKVAGAIAIAIVVSGSALVLVVGEAPTTKSPPTVVAIVNGKTVCGPLARDAAGKGLTVIDTSLDRRVQSVTVVDACP